MVAQRKKEEEEEQILFFDTASENGREFVDLMRKREKEGWIYVKSLSVFYWFLAKAVEGTFKVKTASCGVAVGIEFLFTLFILEKCGVRPFKKCILHGTLNQHEKDFLLQYPISYIKVVPRLSDLSRWREEVLS